MLRALLKAHISTARLSMVRSSIANLAVLAIALSSAFLAPTAASASDTALYEANQALTKGNNKQAIQQIDTLFASGKLSTAQVARALYIRGRAKLASGRQAEAISDFTSAIWTKQLPARLQKDAEVQRALAYQKMGIAARTPATVRSQPASSSVAASAQPAPRTVTTPSSSRAAHKVAQPIAPTIRLQDRTYTKPYGGRQQQPAPSAWSTTASSKPASSQPVRSQAASSQAASSQSVRPSLTWQTATQRNSYTRPAPSVAATKVPPPANWSPASTGAVQQGSLAPVRPTKQHTVSAYTSPPKAKPFTTSVAKAPPPPPPRTTAPPAAPAQSWSALTQQFTQPQAPPRQSQPPTTSSAVPYRPPAAQPRVTTPRPVPPAALPSTAPPAAIAAAPAEPEAPASTSATENVLSPFGSLFGSSQPKSPEIAAADELQRRRYERIRAHNRRMAETGAANNEPVPPAASW